MTTNNNAVHYTAELVLDKPKQLAPLAMRAEQATVNHPLFSDVLDAWSLAGSAVIEAAGITLDWGVGTGLDYAAELRRKAAQAQADFNASRR